MKKVSTHVNGRLQILSAWTSLLICCLVKSLPITRRHILDSSKLKEFADDNFKFDENGRELSKQVENTVGKGEIARYEQFLLYPQCFQKACFLGASKGVIVWEWDKLITRLIRLFTHQLLIDNIVGKGIIN